MYRQPQFKPTTSIVIGAIRAESEDFVIDIHGVWFEGPFHLTALEHAPEYGGIYVVKDEPLGIGVGQWLDVGKAENLRNRLTGHDRELCWRNNTRQFTVVYTVKCAEPGRSNLEKQLRALLNPVCGER